MKSYLLAAAAFCLLMPAAASADDEDAACTSVPQAQWMSEDAVKAALLAQGYQDIRSIEPMGTCYEVYAKTKDGERAELYVDPTTATVTKAED